MYGGVVFVKIVWHGDDVMLDLLCIRPFFQHDEAFAQVFLAGGILLGRTLAVLIHDGLHRDGILLAVFHAFHAANGV